MKTWILLLPLLLAARFSMALPLMMMLLRTRRSMRRFLCVVSVAWQPVLVGCAVPWVVGIAVGVVAEGDASSRRLLGGSCFCRMASMYQLLLLLMMMTMMVVVMGDHSYSYSCDSYSRPSVWVMAALQGLCGPSSALCRLRCPLLCLWNHGIPFP